MQTEVENKGLKQKRLTKEKIASLCESSLLQIHKLLNHFEIEYVEYPNRLAFACPVHGGDNEEGCCIFTDGVTNQGNWSCWTHGCHEEYVNNLFGFVRGCLSRNAPKEVNMNDTASFLVDFLDAELDNLAPSKIRQNKTVDIFNRKIQRAESKISRDSIRNKLQIPSDYYLRRKYSQLVLEAFDVGECLVENQPMSGRVVVPVYDEGYNYVGCVGRAIKEHLKPKWLHSKGFTKNILYGLNLAKERILETRTVVIVEGQGDVWRAFESGLDIAVGIFGCSINDDQLILLEQSGALNMVVLTDYDEAGKKAADQIIKKCGRRFNYIRPEMPKGVKDIGDLTVEQIKELILPQLEKFIK
jgi:5S rRNA maturation endonuclease (ribonuclease M5)